MFQIGVDIGGTFTDCVLVGHPATDGTAAYRTAKALSTKGDLLVTATSTMLEHGADLAEGLYQLWETRKWFVSSEGHRIEQHVRECGAGIMATGTTLRCRCMKLDP